MAKEYLADCTSQYLAINSKVKDCDAWQFYRDYFDACNEGSQTMMRNFSFIVTSLHNRLSFIQLVYNVYKNIMHRTVHLNECVSLLNLISTKLPAEIVVKDVARYFTLADGQRYVRFGDFLYAFQTQLAFSEFLSNCEQIFEETTDPKEILNKMHALNEGRLLSPPRKVIEEVVNDTPNLNFNKFLRKLAKSNRLNSYLSVLPPRSDSAVGPGSLSSTVPRKSSISLSHKKSPRRRKKSI